MDMNGRNDQENEGRQQVLNTIQLIGDVILFIIRINLAIAEAVYRLFVPVTEKSVAGEIVLITGAGHGIGKELALQYASQGATVVCWDINAAGNQKTITEIAKLGYPKAHAYVCDVANRDHIVQTAKKVQDEVGDVTILISNAGIMPCHPFLEHTVDEIQRIININVMANFWLLQTILPIMKRNNHGHIVALSSCAGLAGLKNLVPYCASKFAVRGMMEALNHEFRADPKCQIKATTIYPYIVDTGLAKKPVIRFPSLMPVLSPRDVAKQIMSAQRRNMHEMSLPGHLLIMGYYLRLHPLKVAQLTQDFFESYVDSDL